MLISNARDLFTITDLFPSVIHKESLSCSTRVRGLVVVPGGGGKTTLIDSLKFSNIHCADIDDYWDQQQEQETVRKLTSDWKDACLDVNNSFRRHLIEDHYVLLKARLCQQKWSKENQYDILFVQTCSQASLLMDEKCLVLNLLPTAQLHHTNLYRRTASIENPPDDYDVCMRQWKENEKHCSYVLYDSYEQLRDMVILFHKLILSKRQ
ncbi:unnamed protein product [Rotaria sp. Silwood2]|nr:unnamed protein product [Rotaria sp. Silwood2]CAF3379582.1 unnamed protein product [Rotaria sp. Silwood2]CAF4226995.1 unnamed protein product [Rotaria sp. Silwood2]CAF4338737.1 unnamed protein product [Rotaria sp. Silwood2]